MQVFCKHLLLLLFNLMCFLGQNLVERCSEPASNSHRTRENKGPLTDRATNTSCTKTQCENPCHFPPRWGREEKERPSRSPDPGKHFRRSLSHLDPLKSSKPGPRHLAAAPLLNPHWPTRAWANLCKVASKASHKIRNSPNHVITNGPHDSILSIYSNMIHILM